MAVRNVVQRAGGGSRRLERPRPSSLRARELRPALRPARVRYARVRFGGITGKVHLDAALLGMRLSPLTRGALVNLELTGGVLEQRS
jgi:hypothetical protein